MHSRVACISSRTKCPYLLPIFLSVCSFPYRFYTFGKLALFCDKLYKHYYFPTCHLCFDFAYGGSWVCRVSLFSLLCNPMYIYTFLWLLDLCPILRSGLHSLKNIFRKGDSSCCFYYISPCFPPIMATMFLL